MATEPVTDPNPWRGLRRGPWSTRRVGVLLWHLPRELLVLVLRLYQLTLSPLLGPVCRFAPSCSSYAVTAVRRYGVLHGSWLTARRLGRCHPWNPGGWDPVPQRRTREHGTNHGTSDTTHDDSHHHAQHHDTTGRSPRDRPAS
ncbi:membrane protein insertion efficiency factor YidD [Aquipuribacter nitratireducens]|uniref:Putative membrane protein insertion efficiency factor n=1 Tax=Aquipuribacter nitratireducens TaxID=650104 RepID=A0ABW0GSP2_9MICO